MSTEIYRRVDFEWCRELRFQAAQREEALFNKTPEALQFTRAVLASSAISLYLHTHAFNDVLRAGTEILGKISPQEEWAHVEINEMIAEAKKSLEAE